MTAPRTQQQRRADAEQALIDASAELIAEGGSAAVTFARVGERAGYSRGLVTHHFGNRANLMARVVDDVTASFRSAIDAAPPADTALGQVMRLVDVYLAVIDDPAPVNRARLVLVAEAMTSASEFRSMIVESDRAFRRTLVRSIQRGIDAGDVADDVDATGLATIVIALLRGLAQQAFTDDELAVDAARAELASMVRARLEGAHP